MNIIGHIGTSKPRKVLEQLQSNTGNLSAAIELGDVPSKPYIVCFEENGYYLSAKGYKTLDEARGIAKKYLAI